MMRAKVFITDDLESVCINLGFNLARPKSRLQFDLIVNIHYNIQNSFFNWRWNDYSFYALL